MEKRCFEAELEVRQRETGSSTLAGYAAVFGEWSEDLGGFRERIAPGAFENTLSGDVRALWNHDPAFVLGRTTNGTLRLQEDDRGLKVEIDPPEGALFSSFLENVRRGDVTQMSFGFSVIEDEKSFGETGQRLRLLKEVRLYEVSPVTFPAYPQTEVSLREWQVEEGTEGTQGTGMGEQGTPEAECAEEAEPARSEKKAEERIEHEGEAPTAEMAEDDTQATAEIQEEADQLMRTRRLRLAAA